MCVCVCVCVCVYCIALHCLFGCLFVCLFVSYSYITFRMLQTFKFASPKEATATKHSRHLASTAPLSLLSITSKSFPKKFVHLTTFSIFVNFNIYNRGGQPAAFCLVSCDSYTHIDQTLRTKNYCKYSFMATKSYLLTQIQTFLREH